MNKSKIFISIILLFLIVCFSIFLFGDLFGKHTGLIIQEEFSRPTKLVDISIHLEYDVVTAGENQIVTTNIINMGLEEAEDVLIKYTLWDRAKENKISEYSESVAIQTSLSNVKQIYIPEGLPSGDYVINVEVEYGGKQASTSASFVVKNNKSIFSFERIIIGVGIFISLALLYLIYLLKKRRYKK